MKHLALLLLPLFLLCPKEVATAQTTERPNIIFILTDDQRWDALGYAGNEIVQTPHMDRLADEGLYFGNAFVTTPICAASRASIFTGMYERSHGFTFGTPPLAQPCVDISYPKLLHEAGYRTGFFGKLGMNLANRSDTAIFDEIFTTRTDGYFRLVGPGASRHVHLTDLTTDKAIDFIRKGDPGQPFCLSVSYNAPHADDASLQQYFWPARHDSLYAGVRIPEPALGEAAYLKALPGFLQDSLYLGRVRWRWRYDSPEKYQRMVKGYYRMITTIDDNIGRIRKTLEEEGLAGNTILILMSDNGYFLGERSLAGKWLMYDNSLRVPLLIYDPRSGQRGAAPELVLNIDIAPTLLDFAGLEIPAAMQGRSLKPFLHGKVGKWREDFFCEHLYDHPYIPKSEGVRTRRWKYFRYIDHPDTEELYDLEKDPQEIDNLANSPEHQDRLAGFRRQLEEGIAELEAEARYGQWESIFNGKDLTGWRPKITGYELDVNYKNTFRVEDGKLVVSYDNYESFDDKFGHIFYKEKLSHYKLRLEYRFVGEQVAGAPDWAYKNSGIKFHSQPPEIIPKDQRLLVAVEAQLLGGNGVDERPTGNVCTAGTHIVMDGKLITQHCTNSSSKTYHGDQWVTMEIEVRGNEKVIHRVNGEVVLEYEKPQLDESDPFSRMLLDQGVPRMLSEGYIALQAESHPVEFRNIELMRLRE